MGGDGEGIEAGHVGQEPRPRVIQTSRRRERRLRCGVAAGVIAALALSACFTVSTRSTGAETVDDLQAEDTYKAVYGGKRSEVRQTTLLFAPSGTEPGVCDLGGNKQACGDADVQMIAALEELAQALEPLEVPPRYARGDELLKKAIETNIEALELRNKALAELDNEAFRQHKDVLTDAIRLYREAYEAFPPDNRPEPPP